jgi:hypothetical protein
MELCNIRASADSLLSAEVFLYGFVGGGAVNVHPLDLFSCFRIVLATSLHNVAYSITLIP